MSTLVRYILAILLTAGTCYGQVLTNKFYAQSGGRWYQNNVNWIQGEGRWIKDENSTLYFTLAANTTNTPPAITAASLADSNVTWITAQGSTNSKTPLWSFFTNAAEQVCSVTVSDWSLVQRLNFYQAVARNFILDCPNIPGMFLKTKGLTAMNNCFMNSTNFDSKIFWVIPASVISVEAFFREARANTLYPDFSAATNNISLYYSFINNWYATNTPNLTPMRKITTAEASFFQNYRMPAFPSLTNLPSCSNFNYMFEWCTNATGTVESIFAGGTFTNLKLAIRMFTNCVRLAGNASYFTNAVNCPKRADFTIGNATTCSSYRCFYGCTNLTDWPTLSTNWGGPAADP